MARIVVQNNEVQHGSGGKRQGCGGCPCVFGMIEDEMQGKHGQECQVCLQQLFPFQTFCKQQQAGKYRPHPQLDKQGFLACPLHIEGVAACCQRSKQDDPA